MRTQAVSDRAIFQQLVTDIGSANGRPQAAITLDEYLSAMSDRPVPRIGHLTPHSTVAQLIQYVLDNFLSDDETSQRRSIKQLATLLEVVSGERPVVFLSPTQQVALAHTDVDDELLPAWSDLEPIIAFGEPIALFAEQPDAPTMLTWGAMISASSQVSLLLQHAQSQRPCWVGPLDCTDPDWEQPTAEILDTIRSTCAVSAMFGLSDTASVRPTRPEQRRSTREAAKMRVDLLPAMAMRYLNDRGRVRSKTTTTTDREVAPHIRRGHIRRVWTGPLDGEQEQRPTLIAPVIVNGHLGSPHRPIGYAPTRQS